MFARLGSIAVRYRFLILALWIVAAVVLTATAPDINKVAVSDQRAFLPTSAPSLQAHEIVAKYFPERVSPSSAILVVDAGSGQRADQGSAAQFVEQLTNWLTGPQAPEAVEEVWSPVRGDEVTRSALLSSDKQAALILVRFNGIGSLPTTVEALRVISDRLTQAPEDVRVYMTGDAPILSAYTSSSRQSVDSTTWITIVLVIVILLLIYRSPVSPLIPLLTITLAYLVSRAVVAFLGAHVLTISMYTNVFLVVVLFGAGTDYCLFLISRFREEMTGTRVSAPAVRTTVRAVGETITSSAATVIVGLALMATAELGLYNTSGPSIAIGVAIALIAGLTFTPALLAVLGPYAFWPRVARRPEDTGVWYRWAGKVTKRPLVAFLVPVLLLVPLSIYGAGLERDFDLLGDLSKENSARRGFDVLAEHFGPGQMQPLNVVVIDPAGFDTPKGLAQLKELQHSLNQVEHVSEVRSFFGSLSDASFLIVSEQLAKLAQEVRDGVNTAKTALALGTSSSGHNPGSEMPSLLEKATSSLKGIYGYLMQLASAYPEVLQEEAYKQAATAFGELEALASQAASGSPDPDAAALLHQAAQSLEKLAAALDSLAAYFSANKPEAILLPQLYLERNEGLRLLHQAYFSADHQAARLQVVLDCGPYSIEALDTVGRLRSLLENSGLTGIVEGNSAVMLDLRDAASRDLEKAFVFVLGGIFVVLVVLVRALVAPIYLILTILLSYAATMGVVRVLFVDILGAQGITWWVPMFTFVMLVALGMDYNIFLVGRVKEEVAVHGTVVGTRLALARTGGIITSAGIILAGTFASMISGRLLGLLQIGFAVAFGILLDTFVVRTALVPAITVLLRRWAWWPRREPSIHRDDARD
ncbi:MAG: MMPL family transporter [Thermoleophilia bacterium]|nr:MMPL family transporter [Thermoleophilia bacterium]